MDYQGLRVEYDAAFDSLRAAVWELRSTTQELPSDNTGDDAARQRVDRALASYRERRDYLADFLTSRHPATGSE